MILDHVAIWCRNLEELKDYYVRFFNASPNQKYINSSKGFESYFLSFPSGTRLELMHQPTIPSYSNDTVTTQHMGIIHIAFGANSRAEVDVKAKQISEAGYPILSGPRITGDGYYEFETLDPEQNRIEVSCRMH